MLGKTRVNWFPRTYARLIRVIPTARMSGTSKIHCIRMELYGCSPAGPIFRTNRLGIQSDYIYNYVMEEFSFQAIAPLSKKVHIAVSTAADNTSLAQDYDQRHFYNVTVKQNDLNLSNSSCVISKEEDARTKLYKSGNIECSLGKVDDYNFLVNLSMRVSLLSPHTIHQGCMQDNPSRGQYLK